MKRLFVYLTIAVALLSGCKKAQNPRVVFETPAGDITVEIYEDKAPVTAGNFLKLVDGGAYNTGDAVFYRVVRMDNQQNAVKIEVIQGGLNDRESNASIQHETTAQTGVRHLDGVISMARSEPGTASSEFFICIGDQPELDFGGKRNPDGQGFAAFGRVIDGMEIVKQIQRMCDTAQYLLEPVPITKVIRIQEK